MGNDKSYYFTKQNGISREIVIVHETEWTTSFGAEPEFLHDMFEVPLNMGWTENVFVARFPTTGNNFQPSPNRNMGLGAKLGRSERRGSNYATNIFGRRFKQCTNPRQFRLGHNTGTRYYCPSPSRLLR